jgi:hypothetical protein
MKTALNFIGFILFMWLMAGIVLMFAVAGGWKGYGNDMLSNSYRNAYQFVRHL